MTTTRPGYIWSGTEWIAIGQEAVVAPVSYQATAPTSPATGDIWIDSDDEVPGITSSLNYRWRRIATGGETSLSGNDSSGLPLAYNPGYEQVYLNGVLQYRGSDYVATTGNTITGLTALVANDTIEVLSFVTAPIGDTYTQAAADAKFSNKIVAGSGTYSAGGLLTTTYENFVSFNLACTGRPVLVNFSITFNNSNSGANRQVKVKANLDGTIIGHEITDLTALLISGSASVATSAHSFIVTPSAGTRSFTLQVAASANSSCGLNRASMTAVELGA
jgi:hypothetical protein